MPPHSTPARTPTTLSPNYGATTAISPGATSSTTNAKRQLLAQINPFRYDVSQHRGVLQTVKMVLVGLVLFVPRLFLFFFGLTVLGLAASFRSCCNDVRADPDTGLMMPIKGGAASMFFMRFGARVILLAFGYWWISVDDRRDPEDKKHALSDGRVPVIAANHVSFLDAFYFAYAAAPMGVGKAELFKIPVIGAIARATQMVGVSRQDSKKAHGAAEEITRRTRWALDQSPEALAEHGTWPPLLIFPEATCTNTKAVIQFKLGAFHPMVPVQPVALDFRQSHLDASWVDAVSPAMTAIRMMCQVYNKLTVTILPVERPHGPTSGTPAEFAKTVRVAIARALDVPTTEHNFLDILLAHEAHALRLPRGMINVEMGRFSDKSALDRMKESLRQFAEIDKNKDGFLDEDEFAVILGFDNEALRVAHGSLISAAFAHWDRDGDGKINFREFVLLSSATKVSKLTQRYQIAVEERQQALSNEPSASPAAAVSPAADGGRSPGPKSPFSTGSRSFDPNDSSVASDVPGVAVGGVQASRRPVAEVVRDEPAPADPIDDDLLHAFALSFSAFDGDNDGVITARDFIRVIEQTAPSVSIPQARALFHAAALVDPTSGVDPAAQLAQAPLEAEATADERVTFEQYMRLCRRYPVLVGSLLDAIAAVDVSRSASSRGSRSDSPVAVGDEGVDLTAMSRHNTFVAEEHTGSSSPS